MYSSFFHILLHIMSLCFRSDLCFMFIIISGKSRDGSVGIALGYGLYYRGSRVRFSAGAGNFSLHQRVQNGPTQPPVQWVPGALSLGVKRSGREAHHSPPSSAEVKEWVELYLHSPIAPSWRGAQLKHRDNFTFTFIVSGIYSEGKAAGTWSWPLTSI
jgi:hypothetical protein